MNIAFDIGGCISKYPKQFKEIIWKFVEDDFEINAGGEIQYYPDFSNIFIITDMHPKEEVLLTLKENGLGDIINELF